MSGLVCYSTLLRAGVRAALRNGSEFWMRAAMMALNNVLFLCVWLILFQQVESLHGWTREDQILLFGLAAASFGLGYGLCAGFRDLPQLVASGSFDTLLLRPRSTLGMILCRRSEPSAWGDLFSGVVLIVLSGKLSAAGILMLPLVLSAGAIVIVASGVVFFSAAFWMSRAEDVSNRLMETLITFTIYPETVFPRPFRLIFYTIIPAALMTSIPLRLLTEPSWNEFAALAGGVIAWIAVAHLVFKAGVRRYAA